MFVSLLNEYEYHDKVVVGSYEYYLFINKSGNIIVKRFDPINIVMRYSVTNKPYTTVLANPTILNYIRFDQLPNLR